jgi:glycosyltransferase involved in cell wall biosynthesis
MRILHIIDELKIGGAQTHLHTMLLAARRRYPTFEHRVVGLVEPGPIGDAMRASGFAVDALNLQAEIRGKRFDRLASQLARLIRTEAPDVVEAHLTWSRLLALPAALGAGVPVRIGYEQGDIYFNRAPFRVANFILQHAAQRVVVCSRALGDWAERTHGVKRSRLWVLHNCVDVRRFSPAEGRKAPSPWGFASTTTVFATVGSLGFGVNKRVDVSIRALGAAIERGADVALLVIGDGPQRAELASLATELGISERVRFLGARADVAEILQSCDAFCHAAPFEPFGIVCVEAMAAGLPTLVPDRGGMCEAVIDGRTGFVYRTLDHDALAQAMLELAAAPARRAQMGAAARTHAEQHFSADAYVEALYSGYAELLAAAGRVKGTLRRAI